MLRDARTETSMIHRNGKIATSSRGHDDVIDLTDELEAMIRRWGIRDGVGALTVAGSTAALTAVEYAPGVVRDLQTLLEKLAPEGVPYHHDGDWGDANGYAHLRAALIGPSLALCVEEGKLVRGRWQQFVLCDFDNRPRERTIHVHLVGVGETGA